MTICGSASVVLQDEGEYPPVGGVDTPMMTGGWRLADSTAQYQEQSVIGLLKTCTRFTVLELEGAFRVPLISDLRRQVEALLGRNERRILVNLARVSAIDAAGVGALVDAYSIASRAGGLLQVAGASRRVRRLLDIAGVLNVLSPMPRDAGEAA